MSNEINISQNITRSVYLFDSINPLSSKEIIKDINTFLIDDAHKPIMLFINSAGGRVVDTLAIHDFMSLCGVKISTVGIGVVASMAVLLLSSGKIGQRYITENTMIHLHLPFGRTEIKGTVAEELSEETDYQTTRLRELLIKYTKGKLDIAKIKGKKGILISPQEAIKLGIVDHISSAKNYEI
ncbi:ATP-dependent Clp protease proteolytic subunit [Candidatus Parcubacteria bacterium]|nr:ATP-dependent Clp protease proteolytic subunit [Patescibacteria group bacterium]MCG2688878.1 ATP-dependent Clp protease proteolytic subunit [Candidatus Parcubacteria bacterium]